MYSRLAVLLVCVLSAAASVPQCDHPQCTSYYSRYSLATTFTVEGKNISISALSLWGLGHLQIFCNGWAVLDSPAMPRFVNRFQTKTVGFSWCPPPTRSIVSTLEALNVYIPHTSASISLYNLLPDPALTQKHFKNIEGNSSISLDYDFSNSSHVKDMFTVYKTVHSLNLENFSIPVSMIITNSVVRPLPEMLKEMTHLKKLSMLNDEVDTSFITSVYKYIPATFLPTTYVPKSEKVTPPSVLEEIWLGEWKERRMVPLEHCEGLKKFTLTTSSVEELPSGWMAACPLLEVIKVTAAYNLTTLPAGLLRGAIALKVLNFTSGALESLPDKLLQGAPNVRVVNFSHNRLQTISEAVFQGSELKYLSLSFNKLDVTVIDGVKKLYSLNELDLGFNPSLNDLCLQYGFSNLINLDQLSRLNLAGTNVSHICLDWRASPTITELDLRRTRLNNDTLKMFETQVINLKVNAAKVLIGAERS